MSVDTISETYARDGYVIVPQPLIDADLLRRVSDHMDLVVNGEYETGEEPMARSHFPKDDPTRLIKIDQPQPSDRTIQEFIGQPAFGEVAARVTGAQMVQIWAVQLLFKPGSGTATGNVGWHQDMNYWINWWKGEVFTVWAAVADVDEDMGPMQFVKGSHEWGFIPEGNFFDVNLENKKQELLKDPDRNWEEVPAILPAGGVSVHHPLTLHGSGPNTSSKPRRGFALHCRTENSEPMPNAPEGYMDVLNDQSISPVIFGANR